MKFILTITLLITGLSAAHPCGNEYGYTLDGRMIHTRFFYLTERMKSFDVDKINARLEVLTKRVQENPNDFESWSDIAANYLKIGKADSAIDIIKPWIAKLPNEYNLNANLGTAYELTGQLDSALKYISKGYSLNPSSHANSEWVHKRILEAKRMDKRRTGWIRLNKILNVDSLIARSERVTPSYRSVETINNQIMYQIRTRAPFTPAPNMVITNLLLSLAEFNERIGTYENALLAYSYAIEFEENHYHKRQIKEKIKALNRSRDSKPNLHELPEFFLSMIKRSELDPELLLMGIDDFAIQLDSMHVAEIQIQDSMDHLKHIVDSLSNQSDVVLNESKKTKSDNNWPTILAALLGIFIGMALMYFFRRNPKT